MSHDDTARALLRYPHIGRILRVTERGFGFVSTSTGEQFIHLREHSGRSLETMEGLQGKSCAYLIGGHPFAYSQGKPGWNPAVVEWQLLDDLDCPQTAEGYEEARRQILSALDTDDLRSLLSAEWYVQLWRRKTRGAPQAVLRADSLLDANLGRRLYAAADGEALVDLLASIVESPWYAVSDANRAAVCERFFRPQDWPSSVFVAHSPLMSCRGYATVAPLCGDTLEAYRRKAQTIAIDLETNREAIFEYGWRNAAGTGVRRSAIGLSKQELAEAVQESLMGQAEPRVVGHNLLGWDWPILQKHAAPFPESSLLWDTLVASWILEPWRDSLALVAGERAHSADADAAACYELFERQIAMLGSCLDGQPTDTKSLVERLFEDPSLLSQIRERHYPTNLAQQLTQPAIFPNCRAGDFAWQVGCRLRLFATENRLADPSLAPERCRAVAREAPSLAAKAVAAIIADARSNNVHVRLSNLPAWLVDDDLRAALREAHQTEEVDDDADDAVVICLAEDIFRLSEDEISLRFTNQRLSLFHPEDSAVAFQEVRRRKLKELDVQRQYPNAAENLGRRALLPVRESEGNAAWLLYSPPGFKSESPAWFLLPTIPHWLQISPSQDRHGATPLAWIPRWLDGGARGVDADRSFLSPDTANRPMYLEELTQCLLNLVKGRPDDTVLVVGVRWPEEAAQLQRNLVQLGLSGEHPGTPLRRLESVCQKRLPVLACQREELPKFIHAAARLEKKIQVAIDEVPLHDWYAILNPPPVLQETDGKSDMRDQAPERDEGQSDRGRQVDANARTALSEGDIRSVTDVFLDGWLRGLGMPSAEARACLILDTRFAEHRVAKATRILRRDVAFYALEELLDKDALEVFRNVCCPRRDAQDIPNDYEHYQQFLKENWGYDDFRPGTQKPAIEALIEDDRDMLLRLPTGAGKSIVFHLPALFRSNYSGRLTVVITPLRALMRDQVEGLRERGFDQSVDFLSGGRDPWVNHDVYQGVLDGRIKLVFVAPERFRVLRFIDVLERRRRMDDGLEFVVFDEAHCVSEWGFAFRPDYLHAAKYVADWFKTKQLPGNPHRLLLTSATVTQRNRVDLERELGLGKPDEDYIDLPKPMPHPIQAFIELDSCDVFEDEEAPTDDKFERICEVLADLDLRHSAALVFVRRRKDCHRISDALNARAAVPDSGLASLRALPFHAGLPEAVKSDACDLLNGRHVNVLVCTKAFGMGMDIPHLHACMHHRPPTFIEDYLQEVGRIGRDQEMRESAGHERVTATLLYNQQDIERNLGQLHDNAVTPPDLQDLFGYCLAKGVRFESLGRSLCIVPPRVRISETKEFDENQVANCMFWLERMGVLRVEGRHPPFLDLTLSLDGLRNHASGSSPASQMAAILLDMVDDSHRAMDQLAQAPAEDVPQLPVETPAFTRVVKGLLRGVLALISPAEEAQPHTQPPNTPLTYERASSAEEVRVSLSMSELMSRCGGIGMDDMFAALFELSKAGGVSLRKNIVVRAKGAEVSDDFFEAFFDLLEVAVERLLQPTGGKVEFLERKRFESELSERYREMITPDPQGSDDAQPGGRIPQLTTRQIERDVYRAIRTSLTLVRYAGMELRENFSESGAAQYVRATPNSPHASAARSANESICSMRKLLDFISSAEDRSNQVQEAPLEIPLTDIIEALGSDVRVSTLKQLMKLAENAGFYEFEGEFTEWMTLVSLDTHQPLPAHAPESDDDSSIQRVYTEMLEKHDLQVRRAHAMVLLAAMPTENRKQYIDRYFECLNAEELEELLEDTVGDVDDEVLANTPMLQTLLARVRQERFSEEIEKLNDKQRAVCVAPFDRTLLVNAGPGSGKTHVLMMRCAHLIHVQRINPDEILVLAFNRAVVHEIRDRIRTLFHDLGYGNYVNKLDVSTFHSFALRYQSDAELYEEDAIGQAVHTFAEAMKSDARFAAQVGRQYKAVLVDEFQDMNEDFYGVVKALIDNCRGGGMVIGDDDQDILTWNRRQWQAQHGRTCPLVAEDYFTEFEESVDSDDVHHLTLNYRSLPEIVERANVMIQKAADQVGFRRMKPAVGLEAFRTGDSHVEKGFDRNDYPKIVAEALRDGTVAVLCRSNKECRRVYESLGNAGVVPKERIELLGGQDFALYQLRHSGALLDICRTRNSYDFVEEYVWEEFIDEFESRGLADGQVGRDYLDLVYALVKEEIGRPRVRDLRAFVEEMRASDVERLRAKVDSGETESKVTISTVHKVKGLQYHTVVVMPSEVSFPLGARRAPTPIDAAEEARLCYVAMTRAQDRLYVGWTGRENAWWNGDEYRAEGTADSFRLEGSPGECYVSWAGQVAQVNGDLQTYIEQQVGVGDELVLRGRELRHRGRCVGRLSAQTADRLAEAEPQLRAAHVIRYTCGRHFREHNPQYWEMLDPSMKNRGWFYLVVPEEA